MNWGIYSRTSMPNMSSERGKNVLNDSTISSPIKDYGREEPAIPNFNANLTLLAATGVGENGVVTISNLSRQLYLKQPPRLPISYPHSRSALRAIFQTWRRN
jgi:hypothetical protein